MERDYIKVEVSKKQENRIKNGHPWVYEGEIVNISDKYIDGELVDVVSEKGKYLGTGFINSNSKIRVRIVSRNTNDKFDRDFWKRRIEYAWNYRKTVMGDLENIRVIFGESDGFPGVTVDKFNSVLVIQILCLGMDKIKDVLVKSLIEVIENDGIKIRGVYEREDVSIRALEGMMEYKGWYYLSNEKENSTKEVICENGIKYIVDFENGQKTGYFLDQKFNRKRVMQISKDKNVLDVCTHTGSFALNAYMGGAKKVVALDISESALETARENFKLNNANIDTISSDMFTYLRGLVSEKKREYDIIILDPPAFTKSRSTINNAYKGYKELNYLALKSLNRGGYLVTASCSHFMSEENFKKAIFEASLDATVSLKEVYASSQASDHPVLWGVEETKYLKFYIFQVV